MAKNFITKDKIITIIRSADLADRQMFINLYRNYDLIDKNYGINSEINNILHGEINSRTKNVINKLENEIYTINGDVLTEKEKIYLEYDNIIRFCQKNHRTISPNIRKKVDEEIERINNIIEEKNSLDSMSIEYLKKHISIIQAYLGISIKFFSSAIIALYDQTINQVLENKLELDYPENNLKFRKEKGRP